MSENDPLPAPELAAPQAPEIVVAHDLDDGSEAALRWATDLARRSGRPLRLLHHHDWAGPRAYGLRYQDAEAALAELVESTRRDVPTSVEGEVSSKVLTEALQEHSQRGSLIVVGTRGHSGWRALFSQSQSQELATRLCGELVIVPPDFQNHRGPVVVAAREPSAADAAGHAMADLFDVPVERVAPQAGRPTADELVDLSHGASLIVLERRDSSRVTGLLSGSEVLDLLGASACPVMGVRRGS